MKHFIVIALLLLVGCGAGETGSTDPVGNSGEAGQAGEAGTAGGQAGSSGTSGQAGTAQAGSSGTAGASGEAGLAGSSGAAGEAGMAGQAGTAQAGSAGSQAGSAGIAGGAGVAGEAGAAGTSGSSGSAGTSGTGGTAGEAGTSGSGGQAGTPSVTCGGSPVGTDRCSGLASQTCDASGTWTTVETCQYVCSGAGVCSGSCIPGAKQCSGLGAQTCSAAGQWVTDQTCPYVCSGGTCTGVCVPGTQQCNGLTTQTCSAQGQWVTTKTCQAGPQQDATCTMVGQQATCGVECRDGYSDCDGVAANGCEADLNSGYVVGVDPEPEGGYALYPTNCGVCGHACTGPGVAACQVGICQSGHRAADIGGGATGFAITASDQMWVIKDHATLWYAAGPSGASGYSTQVASSDDYLEGAPMLDPGNNQNPCTTSPGKVQCLSAGNLVLDTLVPYTSGKTLTGTFMQADRFLTRGNGQILEIARTTGVPTTISTSASNSTDGASTTTPTDNYFTITTTAGPTLYRAAAHSTVKQAIRSWSSGWKVNQLVYQGRYLVWMAGLNDRPEFGTYDTLTGQTNVLYTTNLTTSYNMAADSQWVYYTLSSAGGVNIYRIPITGGTPELRVGGSFIGMIDRTLKVSDNYLYWLSGSGMVMYQTK